MSYRVKHPAVTVGKRAHASIALALLTTLAGCNGLPTKRALGESTVSSRIPTAGLGAHITPLTLRGPDGQLLGEPLVQVGGTSTRAIGGGVVITDAMIADAKAHHDGIVHVFAEGFAPKAVSVDKLGEPIALAPLRKLDATSFGVAGGSLATKDGAIAVGFPDGMLAGTEKVALGSYAPDLTVGSASFAVQRSDFEGKLGAAGTCQPEQPLPCGQPTVGLGMLVTVDGPVNGGVVVLTYDLKALAASSDPQQAAAAARLQQSIAQIEASPNRDQLVAALAAQGLAFDQNGQLELDANLTGQPIKDGLISLRVDSVGLLGVDLELTLVSSLTGPLLSLIHI